MALTRDKSQSFFYSYLIFLPIILILTYQGCKASGPPFKDAPRGKSPAMTGIYRFLPPIPFFHQTLLGEVVIKTSTRYPNRNYFLLRILGKDSAGSIRVRSYEGRAFRLGEILELRATRCYIFGKHDWEDRMKPLERWDCDHLIFQFKSNDNFQTISQLKGFQSERTEFTKWIPPFDLYPLPYPGAFKKQKQGGKNGKVTLFKGSYFTGRVVEILKNGQVVVWGYHAGRLLSVRNKLHVIDLDNRGIGTLIIRSRPGDFIIADIQNITGTGIKPGMVVYTNKPYERGDLFE